MSKENVEIVRAAIDGYNRRDWDAALKDAAPDFELDMSRAIGPLSGTYRLNQMHDFWDEFADMFESIHVEAEEWLIALREGAIHRMSMYQSKADVLDAVGLQE